MMCGAVNLVVGRDAARKAGTRQLSSSNATLVESTDAISGTNSLTALQCPASPPILLCVGPLPRPSAPAQVQGSFFKHGSQASPNRLATSSDQSSPHRDPGVRPYGADSQLFGHHPPLTLLSQQQHKPMMRRDTKLTTRPLATAVTLSEDQMTSAESAQRPIVIKSNISSGSQGCQEARPGHHYYSTSVCRATGLG